MMTGELSPVPDGPSVLAAPPLRTAVVGISELPSVIADAFIVPVSAFIDRHSASGTYTGSNDRVVCPQCHDTGNSVTKTSKDNAASVGKQVEGMYAFDPYISSPSIHSASAGFSDNMGSGTKNCLAKNAGCHASPHNPIGEITGGQNCGVCHSGIYLAMQSNTGYHHVVLSDAAPSSGYPTSLTSNSDRTCTICHVDHNYFSKLVNPNNRRAKNLRADITLQPDNALPQQLPRQTHFDNTQTRGGICTSCHELTQTKNSPGTNIKNDGTTTTPVVNRLSVGTRTIVSL